MKRKLKVLDLFSGIGGFSLGLERTGGFETVAFCEIEEFPRKVLAKHWPEVPCYKDVRKLKGSEIGTVDVICGGYPCQPFSTAGKRRGKEDDRHLWPEFMRIVAELRPAWVIGENVAGHISMGLDSVLSDLEGEGYACRPFVIPACAKGAYHRRDRVWTIANAGDFLQPRELVTQGHSQATGGSQGGYERKGKAPFGKRFRVEPSAGCETLADAAPAERKWCGNTWARWDGLADNSEIASNPNRCRPSGQGRSEGRLHSAPQSDRQINRALNDGGWPTEPRVGRMANGVPNGVDRIKSLGNAVVPQIPEMIGRAILAAEAA